MRGSNFYTISKEDVGKNYFNNINHNVLHSHCRGTIKHQASVVDICGYIQAGDVGKRIYSTLNNAGDEYILQMENDEQLQARVKRENDSAANTIALMRGEAEAVRAQITMLKEQIRSREAWLIDSDKAIRQAEERLNKRKAGDYE